jgi:hypothetical protein
VKAYKEPKVVNSSITTLGLNTKIVPLGAAATVAAATAGLSLALAGRIDFAAPKLRMEPELKLR